MRFHTILSVVAIVISGVVSTPVEIDLSSILGANLGSSNSYGAPLAPWKHGSIPGWYYGNYPERHKDIRCLKGVRCSLYNLINSGIKLLPDSGFVNSFRGSRG